ncbi:MAG: DUF3040 domain-containing protein [Caulobacter sp.]|nr:DUF3040 domain-containing protein [Caulobacter sp.]
MADTPPDSLSPSKRRNRLAAGLIFIGSGTTLVAVGMIILQSPLIASAGFALMAVGVVFFVLSQKGR